MEIELIPEDLRDSYRIFSTGKNVRPTAEEYVKLIERIATLTAELAQQHALLLSTEERAKAVDAALDRAVATIARLSFPVSDDEIFRHRSHATNGGFGHRDGLLDKAAITALIASRVPSAPDANYVAIVDPSLTGNEPLCERCGAEMVRYPFPRRPLSLPPPPGNGWRCLSCGKFAPDMKEAASE